VIIQGVEVHSGAVRLYRTQKGCALLGRLTKTLAAERNPMNWLEMTDDEIMKIANPIMDNLMQASTDVDHERHIQHFSERLREIVTEENLKQQCAEYQKELGYFSDRELAGIFRKDTDVRVFWRQWYTKSKNEFIAFIHLVEKNGNVEVVNVLVS